MRSSRPRRRRCARSHRDTAGRGARRRPTRCRGRRRGCVTSVTRCRAAPSMRSTWRAAAAASSAGVAFEPRDAGDERGERRRRPHDQHRERVGAAAGFEKALAQMQQVAARLHFAGAAHVGRIDGQRRRTGSRRRRRCDRRGWRRTRAETRRAIVRTRRSATSSGVARPASCHDSTRGRARAQIVRRQRLDDRERARRRRGVSVAAMGSCGSRG